MKIELYKIEHDRLIHNNDHIIPYMSEPARSKMLEFLEVVDCNMPVNTIFRSTSNQIIKYKKWMGGLRKCDGDIQKAIESGYVNAAKPGWSAHESGRSADFNTSTIPKWENKKQQLLQYGFSGIGPEPWHIHYLDGFNNNEEYVKASITEVLTLEEINNKLSNLGYNSVDLEDNIKAFQGDYGLISDGIAGHNTTTQLILLTKEVIFVD